MSLVLSKEYGVWKTFFIAGFSAQKGIILPSKTSPEIIEAWRNAAAKVISKEGFKQESEAVLGQYPQLVHQDAMKVLNAALSISDEDKDWVRNFLTEKYNARF